MEPAVDRRIWWVFAAAQALQILLLLTVTGSRPVGAGLAFAAFLLHFLRQRRRWAWVLLIIVTGMPLLAGLGVAFSSTSSLSSGTTSHAVAGEGVEWGNLIVLVSSGLLLEAVLLSRPMRTYISSAGPRAAGVPSRA